jgi:hypothetical protein
VRKHRGLFRLGCRLALARTPDALVKQRLLHKDITKFWGGNQGSVLIETSKLDST